MYRRIRGFVVFIWMLAPFVPPHYFPTSVIADEYGDSYDSGYDMNYDSSYGSDYDFSYDASTYSDPDTSSDSYIEDMMASTDDGSYDSSYEFDYSDETSGGEDDWMSMDSDGDGISDYNETNVGVYVDFYTFIPDSSGADEHEGQMGTWESYSMSVYTDPNNADSDGDLINDFDEAYVFSEFNPMDGSDGNRDDDNDLLTVGEEWQLGTSWTNPDTDGGGELDGIEVLIAGTDPKNSDDDTGSAELEDDTSGGAVGSGGSNETDEGDSNDADETPPGPITLPNDSSDPDGPDLDDSDPDPDTPDADDNPTQGEELEPLIIYTVTRTKSVYGGEPGAEETLMDDGTTDETSVYSFDEIAPLEADGWERVNEDPIEDQLPDGTTTERWDLTKEIEFQSGDPASPGENYEFQESHNTTPQVLVEGSNITEESTYDGDIEQKIDVGDPPSKSARESGGNSEWVETENGGAEAFVSEDNYPEANSSHVWLRLNRKAEADFSKTFIVKEVEKNEGQTDEQTTKRYGSVTLTVKKGETTSSVAKIGGNSQYVEGDGGVVTLKAPVGAAGSENSKSVNLFPVTLVQPQLDENYEAVKDAQGEEKLSSTEGLRFCRWMDAFEGDEIWKTGQRVFKNDFISKDRDRVVVRLSGGISDEATITAFVRTELKNGSILDAETEVVLTRSADNNFEYTMAIMTSSIDDQFDPEKSEVEEMGAGLYSFESSDEDKNDPTHEGNFDGKVVIRLPQFADSEVEGLIMPPKASVTVQVYFLPEYGGSIVPYSNIIGKDFNVASELYAQLGVELTFNTIPVQLTEEQSNALYGDDDFICYADTLTMSSDIRETLELCDLSESQAGGPTIFYVGRQLDGGSRHGASFPKDRNQATGYGFVSITNTEVNTLAHELGHILGLADNPVKAISELQMHHNRLAKHYLMADASVWRDEPINSGQRFTEREIKWLFNPRSERKALEAAKSYITHEN